MAKGDTVYRCPWCGRFYSSPLPEGSACPNHIPEWNEQLRADIERFNKRLHACSGGPAFHADCWSCVSLID